MRQSMLCGNVEGRKDSIWFRRTYLHLMSSSEPAKWGHFQPEIILLNVRWCLRHSSKSNGGSNLVCGGILASLTF